MFIERWPRLQKELAMAKAPPFWNSALTVTKATRCQILRKYRTKDEVEQYKQRDPIEVVRKSILDKKFATEKELEAIDQKVIGQVEESVKFAEESKYPDPSEALTDVYVQSDYPFILD